MNQRLDDQLVAQAREAVRRQDWQEAFDLLSRADQADALPDDVLPMLADAAFLTAHPEVATEAWERAHGLRLRAGDRVGAAEAAARVAGLLLDAGMIAPLRAWVRRAEGLLEGHPDSPIHGDLTVVLGWVAFTNGAAEAALAEGRRAVEIATRTGDAATRAQGRILEARALILLGHLEEGLAILDEAAVAATSGELDPFTTAVVYCSTVCAFQGLAEYDRAEEWTRAMQRWCDRHAVGSFHGYCRVHQAEILRLRGQWREAEGEAWKGWEELRAYTRGVDLGWPLSELGLIRLRMGNLAGAEEAFLEAHETGWEPQPGLALLRLAQGEIQAAADSIGDALENTSDFPSWEMPPNNDLRRTPLLVAQVEIALAAGDVQRARWAAGELERVSASFGSKALRANASTARGGVLLAEGDAAAARASFETGAALWKEIGAPYENARARMGLAGALLASGNRDRAVMELRSAHATFERLGAALDARRAAETLAELAPPRAVQPPREQKVFMFTDIVRSTNLVEAIGDDAWGHLVRWHNQTLASLVTEHGGQVVRTMGDGFFVTFDRAGAAIGCAIAVQRALAEHRRKHGFSPRVRIGLHLAEATREGPDWSGKGVHAAARVGALAEGDQILASRETVEASERAVGVSEARSVALKGIAEPVEVVTVDWR